MRTAGTQPCWMRRNNGRRTQSGLSLFGAVQTELELVSAGHGQRTRIAGSLQQELGNFDAEPVLRDYREGDSRSGKLSATVEASRYSGLH